MFALSVFTVLSKIAVLHLRIAKRTQKQNYSNVPNN